MPDTPMTLEEVPWITDVNGTPDNFHYCDLCGAPPWERNELYRTQPEDLLVCDQCVPLL